MKNKEEHFNEHDDTEEFILSIPKTKTESNRTQPEQDALFEVSEISTGSACDDNDSERSSEKEDSSAEKKKIEEITGQLAAANDKYLRLMAEFDNYKRRSAKEYERMIQVANEKLMKDITEVRENFERAFKSKAAGEKLLEGMKLIFSKLIRFCKDMDLKCMPKPVKNSIPKFMMR
jgi:molecular chaperone GrpE